jgi:hypothetical protein
MMSDEVILTLRRNQDDPARRVIGVTRNATADDIRRQLRSSLRNHLQALG